MTDDAFTRRERLGIWWQVYPRYWRIRILFAIFGNRVGGWLCHRHPIRRMVTLWTQRRNAA